MEPLNREGGVDRPRSAESKDTGRVIVIGPYLRTRRGEVGDVAGMDEVGRLFNRNELIVAEVLQSAEVMKASVSYLEPHMEKAAEVNKLIAALGPAA